MTRSSFDIRQAAGIKVPPGYGSHFKSFDGKERKFLAESNGGAELVHRIQCAGRAVVALVRPLLLFRDPHRLGPRRARPADGAAPLRLQHDVALSGLWRLHERAQLPHHHRHPALPRRASDLGAKGIEPDSFFYDKAREPDVAGSSRPNAAVHLRLSRRQSFPLGDAISSRPDAVLARARQRAAGRRISAPAGDERRATTRLRRRAEEEISRRSRS